MNYVVKRLKAIKSAQRNDYINSEHFKCQTKAWREYHDNKSLETEDKYFSLPFKVEDRDKFLWGE